MTLPQACTSRDALIVTLLYGLLSLTITKTAIPGPLQKPLNESQSYVLLLHSHVSTGRNVKTYISSGIYFSPLCSTLKILTVQFNKDGPKIKRHKVHQLIG